MSLKDLIEREAAHRKGTKILEWEVKIAQARGQQTEAARLGGKLRDLRRDVRQRELPTAIARERARLLTLASRHFPELLWEGSPFLSQVRLGVTDVAEKDTLMRAGVLPQGRSSLYDFRDEKVISEPNPQTGSLGRVSECMDERGARWILKRFEVEGQNAARHFFRQVTMLHKLRHPHLVPVVAVWQEGLHAFVQMRLYPGGDLRAWMVARPADGGRDARESLQLTEDILSAITFLHERGMMHCDVKPRNIFITGSGRAVLGDFYGVREAEPEGSGGSESNPHVPEATTVLRTTSGYVAPEVMGQRRMTFAGDVFAAGVVLGELLGGGVLEGERVGMLGDLFDCMLSEDPKLRPSASEALQSPLFSRETCEAAQCIICREILLRNRGISCATPSRHFLCDECLNRQVESLTRIDPNDSYTRAHFKATDCLVNCADPACPSDPFTALELCQHLRPEIHAQRESLLLEAAEERGRIDTEKERERELRRNLPVPQRAMREIMHDILTLRCPRCWMAFESFENCAALNCSRCFCGYCAYCLKDYGEDAHSRVPLCFVAQDVGNRLNTRFSMYPERDEWEVFKRERQNQRIREVLQGLSDGEENEVTSLLTREGVLSSRGILAEGGDMNADNQIQHV
uniref:Protein kinase domain-containing protein n=1 Tax=Chromera velia CCMP2878 TaxID=1169474 RepID=A0A0G4GBD5_9ALVE|eukprot:Cvel_21002.t1-p1 / transcript=Cvel_21002.t1 / gene=Cvel_21002 / organism=Chromera_velia_CCMP2878 / gene_product=Calcium/calmodulin-dependent protein kinase type 1, putative / transcript_product=Calcium/calmodulin-dependent protein kinase type 1, putative / location=Cvel_scaffold1934:31911-33803(+) / protein_length=631 / sequence_SO=supercontig / SO=protein_coding / is_pseudo=false